MVDRLREKLAAVTGLKVFMVPAQDLRVGARQSKAQYQFTLWGTDVDELQSWMPKVLQAARKLPGLTDVSTDREQGGLQADVTIDRLAASRLCVQIQDIDNALNDAFAQRQISTIYTQRNQYRVILEIDRQFQRDPTDLSRVYVKASGSFAGNAQCAGAIASAQATNAATGVVAGIAPNEVPLSAVARFGKSIAPLVVNHQGQFPSITVTYNLKPEAGIEDAAASIREAIAGLHLPDSIHPEPAGDIKAFAQTVGAQPILILAALIAVYIVLGVLYESLAHPLTIISTLPSAGLGALLALTLTGSELTVIAFIGIILLIGIVKKNGIMLVDFALDAERRRGLAPEQAIFEACLERFRPILMTTHDGVAARRGAARRRHRPGIRAAPPARHHHHRRTFGLAGADPLHHAGDLSAARPPASAPVGLARGLDRQGAGARGAGVGGWRKRGSGGIGASSWPGLSRPRRPSSG